MYLDNAATTPLSQEVKDYIISILDDFGNPSSIYELGSKTKSIINKTRQSVLKFIGCDGGDVIFTSSGSASNTLAIKGLTDKLKRYMLYYSPTSHKSMILSAQSCKYNHALKVDKNGLINLSWLNEELADLHNYITPIVCLEVANSEVGFIQNIKEISKLVHQYNGIVIADVTGYIPSFKVDNSDWNVDIITFSGHKLHALKGVGVLWKKNNIELSPLIYGSQEDGLFGGTENFIGIASLYKAMEIYDYSSITSDNRDYVYMKLINDISGCYLVGTLDNRLPHNLYMCFKGINGSSMVTLLDLNGYQVSTGSACNNGNPNPSNTLLVLGIDEKDIHSCVRITFNGNETKNELDNLCTSIKSCVEMLRE